jgi:hypothetical protein
MPFPPDEALGLPVDRLALQLLEKLEEGTVALHRYNFLVVASASYENNGVASHRRVVESLAEAYDWLSAHGLISQTNEGEFITRKGHGVLRSEAGLKLVQAEGRIDMEMHPRIAARVRSQFLLGEYELRFRRDAGGRDPGPRARRSFGRRHRRTAHDQGVQGGRAAT